MNIQKELTLFADPDSDATRTQQLSDSLGVAIVEHVADLDMYLHLQSDRLVLVVNNPQLKKPVRFCVDFTQAKTSYRAQKTSTELLIRAVKIQKKLPFAVVDGTGGLGRDAFLLAAAGCRVDVFEKNKIVGALFEDGLRRGKRHPHYAEVLERITLHKVDMITHLNTFIPKPMVIYLDPMFPKRTKSAKVKQDMQILQRIIQDSDDEKQLFKAAWDAGPHKIVVKRPIKEHPVADLKPSYRVKGKAIRFDVYLPQTYPANSIS